MIKKLRDKCKGKKGFTLVELIVVLVILAILIALLVPSLVGYIDKANQKKTEAEAKLAYTAAQSIAAEQYKSEDPADSLTEKDADFKSLAELKKGATTTVTIADGKVTKVVLTNHGFKTTYEADVWSTEPETK